jgi:hypothetical protein
VQCYAERRIKHITPNLEGMIYRVVKHVKIDALMDDINDIAGFTSHLGVMVDESSLIFSGRFPVICGIQWYVEIITVPMDVSDLSGIKYCATYLPNTVIAVADGCPG